MTADPAQAAAQPRPRADAVRNRESVLSAATRVFAASDSEPSMREIARRAGVGVATLYRHFPTREALVEAVYRDQLVRLSSGAHSLLEAHPPARALRLWMDLFADWLATKHGMTDTLLAMVDTGEIPLAHSRDELLSAIATLLAAGVAAGEIRPDTSAEDVAAALLGVLAVCARGGKREQAERLLDLLMDGIPVGRSPAGTVSPSGHGPRRTRPVPGEPQPPAIAGARCSASIRVGRCVLALGMAGMIEASATHSPDTPYTAPRASTTAPCSGSGPMAQVPQAWW
jgi:AcrR family transcriptional regulator